MLSVVVLDVEVVCQSFEEVEVQQPLDLLQILNSNPSALEGHTGRIKLPWIDRSLRKYKGHR